MNTSDFLNSEVYPQLSHEVVFSNLVGFKVRLNGISATCPECGKKEHFWAYNGKQYGHCYAGSCSTVRGWWQHIKISYRLSDSKDILFKLAELAGTSVPKTKSEKMLIRSPQDLRDFAYKYGKWCLSAVIKNNSKAVVDMNAVKIKKYINSRGFSDEEIIKGNFIYINEDRLFKQFKSHNVCEEVIRDSGLRTIGFGSDYKLFLPVFQDGKVQGFIGRLSPWLNEDDDHPKYKNMNGLYMGCPFMFQEVNGREKYLVIVEGVFDAVKMNLLGIPTVALCGCKFGEKIETALLNAKSNIIISALDDDTAGKIGNIKLIEKIHGVYNKAVFVMPDFKGYKDPLEAINALGKEQFDIGRAEEAVVWLPKNLNINREMGGFQKLKKIVESASIWKRLSDSEQSRFVQNLQEISSLTPESILAAVK